MDTPGSEGLNVYADAKTEYTRQLTQFCLSSYLSYFLGLLEESKEIDKDGKKLLLNFQNSLKTIPEWNHEKVQKELLKKHLKNLLENNLWINIILYNHTI